MTAGIEVILRTIFTSAVAFLIFKRKRFHSMTLMVKFSFIMFIVMAIIDIIVNTLGLYHNWWTYLGAIWYLIFVENHWLFSFHYLRAAFLFRLLYANDSESDLKLVQSRIRWLKIVYFAFGIFLIPITFGGYCTEKTLPLVIFNVIWAVCYWTIALVNLFSMRYIL